MTLHRFSSARSLLLPALALAAALPVACAQGSTESDLGNGGWGGVSTSSSSSGVASSSSGSTSSSTSMPCAITHCTRLLTAVLLPVTMWASTSSRLALIPTGCCTCVCPSTVQSRAMVWMTS